MQNNDLTLEEELVSRCKKGDETAWEKMVERYLHRSKKLAVITIPAYVDMLQQCDIDECCLVSVLNATFSYSLGSKNYFNYFLKVFRNELIKCLAENRVFSRENIISLSDSIPGSGDTLTFEDVIPDSTENMSSRFDSLNDSVVVSKEMKKMDELTRNVVFLRLQGLRYGEIAKILGVSYKVARSRYLKYRETVERKINLKMGK